MVCVPCIVIPVLLWVFHKFVQPFLLKFWNPWEKKGLADIQTGEESLENVDTAEGKYIHNLVSKNPVMLFSKTTCSFCTMAKKVLTDVGVNYELVEIEKMDNCEELQKTFQKVTGGRTVPRVFIGGKCVGGGSETWSLHNKGKLVPMCKEAGATFKKTD